MDDQSSLKHQTGHSKPVHWDNPEGGDGEESGKGGLGRGPVFIAALFTIAWTSRLLPCPGYCKQCCNEHGAPSQTPFPTFLPIPSLWGVPVHWL